MCGIPDEARVGAPTHRCQRRRTRTGLALLIPASGSAKATEQFEWTARNRAASPAETAPIYVLLASSESDYGVGMVHSVAGGAIVEGWMEMWRYIVGYQPPGERS